MAKADKTTAKPKAPKADAPAQKPSMGRIVHFRASQKKHLNTGEFNAALITGVNGDGTADLKVFPRGNPEYDVTGVPFGKGKDVENIEPGSWCWPAKV
jgi:hypothetical protein